MSAADIDAINDFFNRTTANTTAARGDQSEWTGWYKNLSFFDKMTDSTLMDANAKRDRFNIDNGTPPIPSVPLTAEEAKYFLDMPVVDVTGMSPEDAQKAVWNSKPNSPQPVSLTVKRTTIKEGSSGDNVKEWQRIVGGIAVDGKFGATTTAATKKWQTAHNLKADGIVGPLTWGAAYGDLPKLNPEVPSVSTAASAASAQGPAVMGKTYPVSTEVTKPATVVTPAKTVAPVIHPTGLINPPTTVPQPVIQASMFGWFDAMPTWLKWVTGLIVAGGVGYGITRDQKDKKNVNARNY